MKTAQIVGLFLVCLLGGCNNPGPVLVGPDTYLLTRSDAAGAFSNTAILKANVIKDANAFAESKGKALEFVSQSEQRPGFGGGFPSFDYTFKLVDKPPAPEAKP